MPTLTDLQQRFNIPGVTIDGGQGGLTRVSVSTPAAEGQVYLHGAHVTHYQPRGQSPVLFMSGRSLFDPAKAIRGGVPLIFPWFGAKAGDAKAPQHGFARNTAWTLDDVQKAGNDSIAVRLTLGPSEVTRRSWPSEFAMAFTVTFGPVLAMDLSVTNTGSSPFSFEEAMHTYLTVADVRKVTVEGLAGRDYLDKVDGAKRKTQGAAPFGIEGETDRVYLNTRDTVVVNDPADGRTLWVSKQGSDSTVVWNPWVAKAKAMVDFGDDEWPNMICIETANAAENAVTLEPGRSHVMRAEVRASRQ